MSVNVNNFDYLVTAATAAMFTAPGNSQITFLKVTACNNDTVARTLTVYRVGSGGAPGDANRLIKALSIGAGETVVLPLSGQTLVGSQGLQAVADAASKVTVSAGYAQTP